MKNTYFVLEHNKWEVSATLLTTAVTWEQFVTSTCVHAVNLQRLHRIYLAEQVISHLSEMAYLLPYYRAIGIQRPQKLTKRHKNSIYNQVICCIPANLHSPSELLKCPNKWSLKYLTQTNCWSLANSFVPFKQQNYLQDLVRKLSFSINVPSEGHTYPFLS